MDIYFIRHGETEHNRRHLHQPDEVPLSTLGKQQAEAAEPLVAALDPTHLLTSNLTRAAETAEILNKTVLLNIERSELFAELRRPRHVINLHHFGIRSLVYIVRWFFSRNEQYWESVGGESRPAFLARTQEAKRMLEHYPPDARIVVVSHSVFINFFVEHICNERPVSTLKAAMLLLKITSLDNSSLTHVTFDPTLPEGTCKWNVVSFDEDSHVVT